MPYLILIRHGESTANSKNYWGGWNNLNDITTKGESQAIAAAEALKQDDIQKIDIVYTSVLKRSIKSTWIILDHLALTHIPIVHSYRLNEKHYGALQGINKKEASELYSEEQVKSWRRGYFDKPPAASPSTFTMYEPINYVDTCVYPYRIYPPEVIPASESLYDVELRVMPLWYDSICQDLIAGKNVMVVGHGSSLKPILKALDKLTRDEIVEVEVPNAVPIVYHLSNSTSLDLISKRLLVHQDELDKRVIEMRCQHLKD